MMQRAGARGRKRGLGWYGRFKFGRGLGARVVRKDPLPGPVPIRINLKPQVKRMPDDKDIA